MKAQVKGKTAFITVMTRLPRAIKIFVTTYRLHRSKGHKVAWTVASGFFKLALAWS